MVMSRANRKTALVVAGCATAAALGLWAAQTFTAFSLDANTAEIKSQAVALLQAEQNLGVVGPKLAARLTAPGMNPQRQQAMIDKYLKQVQPEYLNVMTPQRSSHQLHLERAGLKTWITEGEPRWVVTDVKLQVQYWQSVRVTRDGAWVKLRGQFQELANGSKRTSPAATFSLHLVGSPGQGYRISGEKWLDYNPS